MAPPLPTHGPVTMFSICQVRPHLFITGYVSFQRSIQSLERGHWTIPHQTVEEEKLRQLGITHCVDATNISRAKRVPGVEYMVVPLNDELTSDAAKHFQTMADFVRQAQQQGGKILIYCGAGVSRAATLTMMSLVINEGVTLREAYYQVASVRPIIAPNLEFWRQMIAWEAERSGGKASVELLTGMRTPVPDVYLRRSEHCPQPKPERHNPQQ